MSANFQKNFLRSDLEQVDVALYRRQISYPISLHCFTMYHDPILHNITSLFTPRISKYLHNDM